MPTTYEINADVVAAFKTLLDDETLTEFAPIREHSIRFMCVVKSKTAGEDGDLVTCGGNPSEAKKVSPLYQLFMDYDYLIVVDDWEWRDSSMVRQRALLHRALMSVQVDITDSGDVKCKKRKTDVNEYRATVERYGLYEPSLESFQETLLRQAAADAAPAAHNLLKNATVTVQPVATAKTPKPAPSVDTDGEEDESPAEFFEEDDTANDVPPVKPVSRARKSA